MELDSLVPAPIKPFFSPKKLSLSIFECFLQPLFILLPTLSL